MVAWQRWQKRETSRTAVLHFGQGIVRCGAGLASSGLGILDEILDAARVSRLATWSFAMEAEAGAMVRPGEGAAAAGLADSTGAISRGSLPPGIPESEDELLVIAHSNGAFAAQRVRGAWMRWRR